MLGYYKICDERNGTLAEGTKEHVADVLGINKGVVAIYQHKICLNKKLGIRVYVEFVRFLGTKVFTAYIDGKKIITGNAKQVSRKLGIDSALVYRYGNFSKQGRKVNSYVLGGVLEVREESLK